MDVLNKRFYLVSGLDLLDLIQNHQLVVGKEVVVVKLRIELRLIILKGIELGGVTGTDLRTNFAYEILFQALLRTQKKIGLTHGHLPYWRIIMRSLP